MKTKSRRQLRAIKHREQLAEERNREAAKLKANAERLRNMTTNFSRGIEVKPTDKRVSPVVRTPYRRETVNVKSATTNVLLPVQHAKRVSPEMQERERRAQAETAEKRKRVAVLYNKGGYQFISDGMDPKTFGRK